MLDQADGVLEEVIRLGNYYDAVGHTDAVYRMFRELAHREDDIPAYPLVVVDEYQDFTLLETSLIERLSSKSPILIAGDDDQALYGFRHASAEFIRALAASEEFAKFPLPFCSRCTKVIVDAVNLTVSRAAEFGLMKNRIPKRYECHLPSKRVDSDRFPRIVHAACSVHVNRAPYMGQYIAKQIASIPAADITESRENKYPTALVIGPSYLVKSVYDVIVTSFPNAILRKSADLELSLVSGYALLARNDESQLGWRIVVEFRPFEQSDRVLRQAILDGEELVPLLPDEYRESHIRVAHTLRKLIDHEPISEAEQELLEGQLGQPVKDIAAALDREAGDGIDQDPVPENEKPNAAAIPDVVCTTLVGAKGLSASYVFVVGMNNGHFPRDPNQVTDSEVCQFLVGLSRTRKQCHLVSCGRYAGVPVNPSIFLDWIRPHLEMIRVDKRWFAAD
jgi:hypothetical protein